MPDRISRELMYWRVAAELPPGGVVGLGPSLPQSIPGYVPSDLGVVFLSESGLIGPAREARSRGRTTNPAESAAAALGLGGMAATPIEVFGAARSGRLEVAVIEASQVSETGAIADRMAEDGWPTPTNDMALGARKTIALMEHTTLMGEPRMRSQCTLPSSAPGVVDLIVTDAAVISVTADGLRLEETAPGWTADDVQAITEATLTPSPNVREMSFGPLSGQAPGKVFLSADAALADVHDGAIVMLDGFAGPGGMAQHLIVTLRDQGAKGLTMISNTAGIARVTSFGTPPGYRPIDHSLLVDNGQIHKAIASFPVSPSPRRPSSFELAYQRGEAELELSPQGTLAERIRTGGYGIGGFYTPTGAGTQIAEGKEAIERDGRTYVLEQGLWADFALIRAYKADTRGNLVYKGTSRNFNSVMAPAARITVVEVDEIVEPGQLDPDAIVTPGVFVHRIVRRPADFSPYEKADG